MSLIRSGALVIVAFIFATIGADLVARISVAGDPAGLAASEHLYWAAVAKRSTMTRAMVLFGVIAAALLSLYYFGYHGSQLALRDAQWTAAGE